MNGLIFDPNYLRLQGSRSPIPGMTWAQFNALFNSFTPNKPQPLVAETEDQVRAAEQSMWPVTVANTEAEVQEAERGMYPVTVAETEDEVRAAEEAMAAASGVPMDGEWAKLPAKKPARAKKQLSAPLPPARPQTAPMGLLSDDPSPTAVLQQYEAIYGPTPNPFVVMGLLGK